MEYASIAKTKQQSETGTNEKKLYDASRELETLKVSQKTLETQLAEVRQQLVVGQTASIEKDSTTADVRKQIDTLQKEINSGAAQEQQLEDAEAKIQQL